LTLDDEGKLRFEFGERKGGWAKKRGRNSEADFVRLSSMRKMSGKIYPEIGFVFPSVFIAKKL